MPPYLGSGIISVTGEVGGMDTGHVDKVVDMVIVMNMDPTGMLLVWSSKEK